MARGGRRGGGSAGGSRGGGSSMGGSRGGGSRLGGGPASGRGGVNRGGVSGNRPPGNYNRPTPGGGFYGGIPPFLGGYGLGRSFGPRRRYSRGGYGYNRGGCVGCGGGGCFSSILIIFLVLFVFNFLWGVMPGNNSTAVQTVQIPASTIERKPIEAGLVNKTGYYEDNLGWIKDPKRLEKGLAYFYDKTNVQPFVYITDNIDGDPNPTLAEIDAHAHKLYDELFTDEAHLLLVHFENYQQYQYEYSYHTVYGSQAKVLMDEEAETILFDYLDYHYQRDPNQVSEEDYFSEAFKDTADRIMTVTRSPWIPVFLVVGVAVVLLTLFNWWRTALSKEKTVSEQTVDPNPPKKEEDLDEFDF